MRHTLLSVVQATLNDMDSDSVTAITDTEESRQIASIARDVYFAMADEMQIPYHQRIVQLETGGAGKYNYLKLPDNVKNVKWIKYDCSIDIADGLVYTDITYLPPEEFMYLVTKRNSTESNVDTVTDPVTGVPILVLNDKHPAYWTSFDDKYVCFDSYNSTVEAALATTKSMVGIEQVPAWTESGSFEIPLPDHLQSLYLNEVKSMCFLTLKQMANEKIELTAQRLRFTVSEQKARTDPRDRRPNYGRR